MTSAVSIQSLKKSFDQKKSFILKGIHLEIPKGKITTIIGFSGTGKSVLLKHILGLIRPTSGSIKVLGKDIWQMSDREWIELRTNLGVLFQHAALFDDLTAVENVCFPLQEHRREMKKQDMILQAQERLVASGLEEEHHYKLPSALSGGMRKRVGLARALVLDPEIILYDEPTTGLDPILTEMVDNLILDTHKSIKGATSMIVTHDLAAAFRLGAYVVMLDKGKILLSGTSEDFFNSDIELVRRFVTKGLHKDVT